MNELNNKKLQAENEMDDIIKRRVYGNGVTEITEELREKMIEIISSCKDMAISTIREDGWPQANTVGFVNMDENIFFETFAGSSKAKNIERDPRVSIAIWPPYENVGNGCGISMAAYAEKVTDEATAKECSRLLLEKMPELAEISYNDGDPVFPDPNITKYRLRPVVISILDFEKGFGHADFVVMNEEFER
ncbi:pyridoxamine 5'-phosphate oxidase family protein [Limisalsivibrio acetivorans]|uniref:pyridoxamine 5'-phosphate oxidase family protein n=1 Tax=Limisalsivibrio acetivorans TaxID=1304888 RepID=UPI0003B4F6EE|nr:pyridoxamine 5'-phosphate oxidase family protein [Limisalsivibrio acetivorans]